MQYLNAFLCGGILCAIGQIFIDKTKLTPARILTGFVVAGVFLEAIGVYAPIAQWGGAGATVPLTGFGSNLAKGVAKAVGERSRGNQEDREVHLQSPGMPRFRKGRHVPHSRRRCGLQRSQYHSRLHGPQPLSRHDEGGRIFLQPGSHEDSGTGPGVRLHFKTPFARF